MLYYYYIIIYLITSRSRVLLDKLTGFQLVKGFPAFYGTRKFITAFTSARHYIIILYYVKFVLILICSFRINQDQSVIQSAPADRPKLQKYTELRVFYS